MHWTFLRDLDEPVPLIGRELPLQMDLPLDVVESSLARVAVRAVLCPHLRVRELHANPPQRPLLAACVHGDRHRRAGTEGGKQQLIGIRACVAAAGRDRFVGRELVHAGGDALHKAPAITLDSDHRSAGAVAHDLFSSRGVAAVTLSAFLRGSCVEQP